MRSGQENLPILALLLWKPAKAYVPLSSHGAKARKNRHARENSPIGIIDAILGLMNRAVKQILFLPRECCSACKCVECRVD